MPKPIICLSETLRQYADAFRPCFSSRQFPYFVIVLWGLIECQERRTLSGLVRTVGERVSVAGVSRFLSRWQWSTVAVTTVWLQRFRQRMAAVVAAEHARLRAARPRRRGHPQATVVTGYLILDDAVHVKPRGRDMGGLGRHFATTQQQTVTGHCLFTGLYALLGRRCPLAPQVYRQQAVCEREGVAFRSKIDLAVAAIEDFEPAADTQTHVLIDSWYHCQRVRRATVARGFALSGALKSNRHLRLTAADGTRTWQTLSEYAAALPETAWAAAHWPSASGGTMVYVHHVRTRIKKLGASGLLLTRPTPMAPLAQTRYWASTLLDADVPTLLATLAQRWQIEVLFEDYKDLLGSDHYQLMHAHALVRFWTILAAVAYFLDEQRDQLPPSEAASRPSWGEVRLAVQRQHQRNFLSWLEGQFRAGVSAETLARRLVA